jgi:hypothetical protein
MEPENNNNNNNNNNTHHLFEKNIVDIESGTISLSGGIRLMLDKKSDIYSKIKQEKESGNSIKIKIDMEVTKNNNKNHSEVEKDKDFYFKRYKYYNLLKNFSPSYYLHQQINREELVELLQEMKINVIQGSEFSIYTDNIKLWNSIIRYILHEFCKNKINIEIDTIRAQDLCNMILKHAKMDPIKNILLNEIGDVKPEIATIISELGYGHTVHYNDKGGLKLQIFTTISTMQQNNKFVFQDFLSMTSSDIQSVVDRLRKIEPFSSPLLKLDEDWDVQVFYDN